MALEPERTLARPAPGSPASTPVTPSPWSAFWQTLIRYQREKVAPGMALRNAIGIAIPLGVGLAIGNLPAGLVASTGALNVAFSDSEDPYVHRARRMLAACVLVTVAVIVGAVWGQNPVESVLVTTVWAFAAGLAVSVSMAAADIGVISLVTLVVFAGQPMAAQNPLLTGALAFTGGLLQTLLAVALWPVRRYEPERRALGELYHEMSRVAALPAEAKLAPPASVESTKAQASLEDLSTDHSVESERYRSLLNQAERMRLSLLALARMRSRIGREDPDSADGERLDQCFAITSRLLGAIGDSLMAGHAAHAAPECLQQFRTLTQEMGGEDRDGSLPTTAMLPDVRFQLDALAGQLRAAVDLAASATPVGRAAFEQREARQPWSLRLSGTLATLRANLTLRSAACRHAIRLAVCIGLGEALARAFSWERSYWLPLTVAIVLKPDFTATFSRGVLRLTGTFAGLAFSTVLVRVLPPAQVIHVVLIVALVFVLRCFGPANFGIVGVTVTALVVLLLGLTGVAPAEVIAARGFNTTVGGAMALAVYAAWPTWERTHVSETLAHLLDSYRQYFRAVREAYLHADSSFAFELDQTRNAARLTRSNLEASMDRFTAEPGVSAPAVHSLAAMLASSHRLVHAIMALEAGLSASRPVPARDAFRVFADQAELTLYYQAAALRGSPLTPADLPDLRSTHQELVRSGDALTERYALVNVETDRMTNSLNTLSAELLRWVDSQQRGRAAS